MSTAEKRGIHPEDPEDPEVPCTGGQRVLTHRNLKTLSTAEQWTLTWRTLRRLYAEEEGVLTLRFQYMEYFGEYPSVQCLRYLYDSGKLLLPLFPLSSESGNCF